MEKSFLVKARKILSSKKKKKIAFPLFPVRIKNLSFCIWNPNVHIKYLGFLVTVGKKYSCVESPLTDHSLPFSLNTETSARGL